MLLPSEGEGPIAQLNRDPKLDFLTSYSSELDDNDVVSPYVQDNNDSPYIDLQALITKLSRHTQPLFFSLNTQSS